jgi:type IV pilus assembly protein PilP
MAMNQVKLISIAAALLCLAGCSDSMDELKQKVAEIKSRPGERIDPMPEIKPYESFAYGAATMRSPFIPSAPVRSDSESSVRPNRNRPREFLEQVPLDTLRMVGTLDQKGRSYALVQGKDGLVHRVSPGNYMGQNDGRILSVTATKISLIEIVPDGVGGYIERPAALALNE